MSDRPKLPTTSRSVIRLIGMMRGIDREQGCMIVVRPDQYTANILPLDGYQELADFFAGFLLDA